MASPVGHALMGVALYAATVERPRLLRRWGWFVLCVGFSVLPDLDFIIPAVVGRIDWAHALHRSFTHTVFFAAGVAAVWFIVARVLKGSARTATLCAAVMILVCLLAHLGLDVINEDTTRPYGVSVFWPAWGKSFYHPIGHLPRVEKLTYGDIVSWHNVKVALTELALFSALILAVLGVRFAMGRLRRSRYAEEPAGQPPAT